MELTEPLLQNTPNETLNSIIQTTNDSNIQEFKKSSAKRKSNEISSSAPTGNSSDNQPTTSIVNQQKKQRDHPTTKPQTESISAAKQKRKRGRPKKKICNLRYGSTDVPVPSYHHIVIPFVWFLIHTFGFFIQ